MNADRRGPATLRRSSPFGIAPERPGLVEARPNALTSYLRALRSHPLVVAAAALAAIAASMAWLSLRGPSYEASAKILVTPVPEGDRSFVDLPLPRTSSGDPARAVHTAAELVETPAAAAYAASRIERVDAAFVRTAVQVEAVGESDVVEVRATASDAQLATEIANAYAQGALKVRRDDLRQLVAEAISNTQRDLAVASDPDSISALETRLADLRSISDGSDPTVSLAQQAVEAGAPAGPPRYLVLAIAALAGFAIGTVAAVLIELLVPRRLREDSDVQRTYPLPVLTRIPLLRKPQLEGRRAVENLPLPLTEALRALRTQLELRAPSHDGGAPGGRIVAIAGASRGEGRTTTAIGLASVIGRGGGTAIVVDLDLRSPFVATALGLAPTRDLASLLSDDGDPGDLLTPTGGGARVFAIAAPAGRVPELAERIFLLAPALLERLRAYADWVIVDTSPLSESSDMLNIAPQSDHVILLSRLEHTPEAELATSRDLLEIVGVTPTGHVLIGGRGAPERGRRAATFRPAAPRRPARSR